MGMVCSDVGRRSHFFSVIACFCAVATASVSANSQIGEHWKRILNSVSGTSQEATFRWEYPQKDSVQESINIRVDGRQRYFSRRQESGNFYEEAFDGLRTRQLYGIPSSNKYYAVTGPGPYFNPRQTELCSQLMPFEFSYGLLGISLDKFAYVEEKVLENNPILVGLSAIYTLRPGMEPAPPGQIMVEASPADPSRFDRYLLQVDPSRGYAVISRKQFSSEGNLVSELRGEGYSNQGGGIWVPETIKGIWYARDRENKDLLEQHKVIIHRESIRINPQFSTGDFEVEIPLGASIHEYSFGESVTGPVEILLQKLPENFLDLPDLDKADSAQQTRIPAAQMKKKEAVQPPPKKPIKVETRQVSTPHTYTDETAKKSLLSTRTIFSSAVAMLVIAGGAWMLLSKRRGQARQKR